MGLLKCANNLAVETKEQRSITKAYIRSCFNTQSRNFYVIAWYLQGDSHRQCHILLWIIALISYLPTLIYHYIFYAMQCPALHQCYVITLLKAFSMVIQSLNTFKQGINNRGERMLLETNAGVMSCKRHCRISHVYAYHLKSTGF